MVVGEQAVHWEERQEEHLEEAQEGGLGLAAAEECFDSSHLVARSLLELGV
jgi:hypothetical protein